MMQFKPKQFIPTKKEQNTGSVYGETFSLYTEKEFEDVMKPLGARLRKNAIKLEIFKNKICLDLGCGSGRGSVFMLKNGAASVFAVDIDANLTSTTEKWANFYGYKNIEVKLASALNIPYPDNTFDFVWCNGVLHRTNDPDRGINEIGRVLKPGGSLFLYMLGAGGVNYHFQDWARELLKGFDFSSFRSLMMFAGIPKMDIAILADDWFNSYFKRYRASEISKKLLSIGFSNVKPLFKGVSYDSSQKLSEKTGPSKDFLGEGDLRFFATGLREKGRNNFCLPDVDSCGTKYEYPAVLSGFRKIYEDITAELSLFAKMPEGALLRLMMLYNINKTFRQLLDSKSEFDCEAYAKFLIDDILGNLQAHSRLINR